MFNVVSRRIERGRTKVNLLNSNRQQQQEKKNTNFLISKIHDFASRRKLELPLRKLSRAAKVSVYFRYVEKSIWRHYVDQWSWFRSCTSMRIMCFSSCCNYNETNSNSWRWEPHRLIYNLKPNTNHICDLIVLNYGKAAGCHIKFESPFESEKMYALHWTFRRNVQRWTNYEANKKCMQIEKCEAWIATTPRSRRPIFCRFILILFFCCSFRLHLTLNDCILHTAHCPVRPTILILWKPNMHHAPFDCAISFINN